MIQNLNFVIMLPCIAAPWSDIYLSNQTELQWQRMQLGLEDRMKNKYKTSTMVSELHLTVLCE